jgi:hypothetical protein
MSVKPFLAYSVLLLLLVPFSALAAGDMGELLPPISCGAGWKIDGTPIFHDRDTLSDRINGEAELYFPYGFDRMAAARYTSQKNPGAGMDVEIYRMGSPLDAFGMYANYRQNEGRELGAGTESNLSGSQLFLYQGRYFIHLQVTGIEFADPDALSECARLVASRMPGTRNRPPELAVFDRPEIVKGTERYLPQSLLGYDFLNRGIMSDAVVEGMKLQIFLLLGTTAKSVSAAFDGYRFQLVQGKVETGGEGAVFLEGVDPLYGPVIVLRKGDCLAGALKFSGKKGVRTLLERVCR